MHSFSLLLTVDLNSYSKFLISVTCNCELNLGPSFLKLCVLLPQEERKQRPLLLLYAQRPTFHHIVTHRLNRIGKWSSELLCAHLKCGFFSINGRGLANNHCFVSHSTSVHILAKWITTEYPMYSTDMMNQCGCISFSHSQIISKCSCIRKEL